MDHANASQNSRAQSSPNVALDARPERTFIRPDGSFRHVDFRVKISRDPRATEVERSPLTLALVLDRSGSMEGEKLTTAKRAVVSLIERLEERDEIALVVFDDQIEVLQQLAPVTGQIRQRVRSILREVSARASTALHEGWLTGAREIAPAHESGPEQRLGRVLLLTDGLANVGVQDPEQIASEAAAIRDRAGIGTSTFGIGPDYNEALLGPMAVAGGGQFHHLRSAHEISSTFAGELGELFAVAARQVRLEFELTPGTTLDVVSAYHTSKPDGGTDKHSLVIGDLAADEERHVVVRFGFPSRAGQPGHSIRVRVSWRGSDGDQHTSWQEVCFAYADNRVCSSERRNASVMHWVGLHHAERVKAEAVLRDRNGDRKGAQAAVRKVADRIAEYAGGDPDLRAAVAELRALELQLEEAPLDSLTGKEQYFQSLRTSRAQKDWRQ